jgi:BioD-like phosphotransacetylase family protein
MGRLVITSMRHNAGKTSVIIGLASAMNKKAGYIERKDSGTMMPH